MFRSKRHRNATTDEEDDGEGKDASNELVHQSKNRVYFHAPVNRKTILALVKSLEDAQVHAQTNCLPRHVLLFIHSEGGDAYAGLSGMNHIQTASVPVITIADGFVASAATFLLFGGYKRYCMPHSVVLIHQVSTGFWGKHAELIDEMQNSNQLMDTIRSLYASRSSLKKKKLESILQKELTMTAQECIKAGIVA